MGTLKARIGTSGYSYQQWGGGVFYPQGLSQDKWLEYYCQFFDVVELNVTFYRLSSEKVFMSWFERTPREFVFVVKGSRFITHVKRLKDAGSSLELLASRLSALHQKARVLLWQLPPRFKMDIERLSHFTSLLKEIFEGRLLHVFEFRDESWLCPEVYKPLAEKGMSVCLADHPVYKEKVPVDRFSFVYLRRHGASAASLYSGCYSMEQLREDARNIRGWLKEAKPVFIFFNNDAHGYAVKNALQLQEMIDEKAAP